MTSLLFCLVGVTIMAPFSMSKVIDLSHKHGPDTVMTIKGTPGFNLTNLLRGTQGLGVYVEANYYGSSEHGGTHMDAPSHFVKGGMTLDQIPIEYTVLDGVRIDCSAEAAKDKGFAVTVETLKNWEKQNGKIPNEAAVLFYFGWGSKFDNEQLYKGTTNVNNYATYVYPYVTPEAGRWLLDERNVRTLASDTLTVDPFGSDGKLGTFPIHVYLLGRNRILVENLRDLDKLPNTGFRFHAVPVKYVGASGTQVRAYAVTHDTVDSGSQGIPMASILVVCLAALVRMFL